MRMPAKPKATVTLLSLALAAGLVACSSDSDESGPKGDEKPSAAETGVSGDFPKQDVIITAVCSPNNGAGAVVRVDGWNPRSWKQVAHAEFPLPDTAVIEHEKSRPASAVRELCEPQPDPADAGDAAAVRSLFDQDFTRMAVVTEDPQTRATHVGYVDRSGKFTDLTGNEDFGDTPEEDNAAFARDGSAIWLTYEVVDEPGVSTKDRLASRAVAGDHQLVDRLEADIISDPVIVTGSPGTPVLADSAHISPDGKHLLAEGRVLDVPENGEPVGPEQVEEAPDTTVCPGQVGWVDNDTVLCDGSTPGDAERRFATVDITPNAEPGPPIIPGSDRRNYGNVISPDGRNFVFFSTRGAERDHFISSTEPGSTPKKVERKGEFAVLGETVVFIDWR
ncbi:MULTISPECIES: hypothetical protein [unclassified Streptomyces]|uniref:hypothetical protein n=1 Tax=unclassified Streptomyces TaxID=2593676 RepID=UPI000F743617|nr:MULTISPECIES: hypothetical protein [unclassified Streptomyces]